MKGRGIALVLAICALPAHGNGGETAPPPEILHMLTPIDCTPTPQELTARLGPLPGDALGRLRGYALDPESDFGVRLRATRAIPHFCRSHPQECHSALFDIFDQIEQSNDSPGKKILRYRAAIEALGAARTGEPGEPDALPKLLPFLSHPSRDLRVSAVRALRDLCHQGAVDPLRARLEVELVLQVQYAISAALEVLDNCSSP